LFDDMNPSELSLAMNSGWSFAKSTRNISKNDWKSCQTGRDEPITWPHSVGIVASYSYIVMVKAANIMVREDERPVTEQKKWRTINFLLFFHEQERIVIDVAVEMNVGSVDDVIRYVYSSGWRCPNPEHRREDAGLDRRNIKEIKEERATTNTSSSRR
jgi:hypothetical protein